MKHKTLPTLVCILFFSFATKAQITKGSVWTGGNLGFYGYSRSGEITNEYKDRSVSIAPAVGKAIKENTIVGVAVNYVHQKTETPNNYNNVVERRSNTYGLSPFIRQYVPVVGRLSLFGQGNVQAGMIRRKVTFSDNSTGKEKGWSTGVSVTPGISYALHKKWQLEAGFNNLFSASYNNTEELASPQNKVKNELYSAGINLDNASQLYLGFRLLLTK